MKNHHLFAQYNSSVHMLSIQLRTARYAINTNSCPVNVHQNSYMYITTTVAQVKCSKKTGKINLFNTTSKRT